MRVSDGSSIKAEVVDIPRTTTEPTKQHNNPMAEETSKIQETSNKTKKRYNLLPNHLVDSSGIRLWAFQHAQSTSGAGKGGDSLTSHSYLTTLLTLNGTRYKRFEGGQSSSPVLDNAILSCYSNANFSPITVEL